MARELTLIVTDLHLGADSASMESPPLEALELLMARASTCEVSEWRECLAATAGVVSARPPVAAVSRCADQVPQSGDWWLANPVHFEVGLDHVRLARLLTLTSAEWLDVEAGIRSVLDGSTATFGGSGGANAYLLANQPIRAQSTDPARVLGTDVHSFLPSGPDSALLKRVMTELQMWLHDHPVNARREQRGELPVNAFWIWGGGSLPGNPLTPARDLPALFTDDVFATGLWRLASAAPQPLPARFDAVAAVAASGSLSTIIAVTLRHLAGESDGERMKVLDKAWIAPALGLLRRGAVRKLRLHLNDRLFTVSGADLWRLWRRRRSWLEAIR